MYCTTMSFRTFGRFIILFTLYVNIHDLHAKGPGINTLYVPIGQLHPRSDFAGVLTNLNVAAAIKRGKDALELANKFLHYHRSGQKIGKWTGSKFYEDKT